MRFLPSSGVTKALRSQKLRILTGCIIIRHPEITSGSIALDISIAAAIPGYSPPWMPAVIKMSDTMDICGLKAERGQKLQTYIPVLDSNTKIPMQISIKIS